MVFFESVFLILIINLLFVCSISGFNIIADIVTTKRGFPRIYYNGYNYGFKRQKKTDNITTWMCTANNNKRRCIATVDTKYINGVMMMKEQNCGHICNGENLITGPNYGGFF